MAIIRKTLKSTDTGSHWLDSLTTQFLVLKRRETRNQICIDFSKQNQSIKSLSKATDQNVKAIRRYVDSTMNRCGTHIFYEEIITQPFNREHHKNYLSKISVAKDATWINKSNEMWQFLITWLLPKYVIKLKKLQLPDYYQTVCLTK